MLHQSDFLSVFGIVLTVLFGLISVVTWRFPRLPGKRSFRMGTFLLGALVVLAVCMAPFVSITAQAGYKGAGSVSCGSLVSTRTNFSSFPQQAPPPLPVDPNNPRSAVNAYVHNGLNSLVLTRSEAIGSCHRAQIEVKWLLALVAVAAIGLMVEVYYRAIREEASHDEPKTVDLANRQDRPLG